MKLITSKTTVFLSLFKAFAFGFIYCPSEMPFDFLIFDSWEKGNKKVLAWRWLNLFEYHFIYRI